MNIHFNARVDAFIPGNFISWRIIPIPGQKTPAIEDDYDLTGTEIVRESLRLTVSNENTIAFMPHVHGYERLKDAVFEIVKTDRKRFRVVRYVGTLKVVHTIEPVPAGGPKNAGSNPVADNRSDRFLDLDGARFRRFADLDDEYRDI